MPQPPTTSESAPDAADGDVIAWRERAAALGLAFVETVPDAMLDAELTRGVPVEWARAHLVLPVRWKDGTALLTARPEAVDRQEEAALVLGTDLEPIVAPPAVVREAIERCYFSREDSPERFLRGLQGATSGQSVAPVRRAADDLLEAAEEAPVAQLVNLILLEAVRQRASDIHFEPMESRLRVRYRVDGVLYDQAAPPKNMEQAVVSRIKVMAHLDIAEKRLPQDGMARVRVGEREIDVRVSTVPVADGERVVLRLLHQDASLLPLTDLGMPPPIFERFDALLREAWGLIVVCGPTGSGKTTTLYAALRRLDTARRNILTIEEPIEYRLPHIGQMQVKPKIGLTFARALRHVLRQDPDVILVGETRDQETAEIAVRASLTGHLVFTTLHTGDAAGAVVRLADMGVESFLLADALRGALAQRLARRLCPRCRIRRPADERDLSALGEVGRSLRGQPLWAAGAGCPSCLAGYRGRLGLFELLVTDDAVRALVRAGARDPEPLRRHLAAGALNTLAKDGLAKLEAGETSLDELLYAIGRAENTSGT